MSGIAVVGSGEPSVGLVPRYLRAREHSATPVWAPAHDAQQAARHAPASEAGAQAIDAGQSSMTEELRQRIAGAGKPEKRRRVRPVLFGVAALAVILLAILLFPDTVVALLPDPS
jgi:hypothetical protein